MKAPSQAGFTLIEIMVAMVILAFAMVATYKSMAGYVSNAGYLEQRTLAQLIAANVAEEMRVEEPWPSVGKKERNIENFANHDWLVRTEVSQEGDAEWMRAVRVKVYLDESGKQPLSQMVFYVAELPQ